MKTKIKSNYLSFLILLLILPSLFWAADNSLCAVVKIEIKQELSLERQAFDAHMRINNGLTNLELENEVDALVNHPETTEFIELYDGGIGNSALDGLVLVLFNGELDQSYQAFDLDGFVTNSDGYFVIGGSEVAGADLIITETDWLADGADALAVYIGNASDFPEESTIITTIKLLDALVYDSNDADDIGLLSLLNPEEPQINEGDVNHSIGRCENGEGGQRNTSNYLQIAPTPGITNNCQVELTLSVSTDEAVPLKDLKVYVFNAAGTYTGISGITDVNGEISFDLTDFAGEYKFRIDYLSSHFWSEIINLPGTTVVDVVVPHEILEIQLSTVANIEGIKIYLFSESGAYLGRYAITDSEGKVSFDLPVGQNYTFRADILGGKYWSNVVEIGGVNTTIMAVGGGTLQVQLTDSPDKVLSGVKIYLFSEAGSYLGLHQVSDVNGEVSFAVPPGSFKIRADYLGYKWWSDPVQLTADTLLEVPINQDDVTITVSGNGPMKGLKVYLFTPNKKYLGKYKLTNDVGLAVFNLPAQPYKVRVDYLSQQYWSAEFAGNNVDVIIPMAEVEVKVLGNNLGLEDVTVYAFNDKQSYLGINLETDVNGIAAFTLPAGNYLFRADYQSNQYWGETATVVANQLNSFNVNTGGGTFAFKILSSESEDLVGIKCYVFDENGSYVGLNAITDADGLVNFDLSNGVYQFRVDYLGYKFWSEFVNIPSDYSLELLIPHETVTIDVLAEYLSPESLAGVKVYLFSENGNYLNKSQVTDDNGKVSFYLPQKLYKARADYLKNQYWSDAFIWEDADILIPMGLSHITAISGGNPLENIKIYAFTPEGSYLGLNQNTSVNGFVDFVLPEGQYKFRADYQGSQFWSDISDISAGIVTNIDIDTGGGVFAHTLLRAANMPMENVKSYVFNENGSYLGLSAQTDSSGGAEFDLSAGNYKIRVDYLGYKFWSPIYTLPDVAAATLMIDHEDVTVDVLGSYNGEFTLDGLKVYLFSSSGSYLGKSKYTDENGEVVFNLPDQAYKVRADYFGGQYWSQVFQYEDIDIVVPHGEIIVNAIQNGEYVANARVYVFSATGSYLSKNAITDENGEVRFLLPAKDYKFRVDFGGNKYWSDVTTVFADIEISVEVVVD